MQKCKLHIGHQPAQMGTCTTHIPKKTKPEWTFPRKVSFGAKQS